MDSQEYQRWREPKPCFLPTCFNNDVKNPLVKFFAIRKELKENWCQTVGRNCPKRRLYCCEDHINIEEDIENYEQWITGANPRLKLNATLKNFTNKAMPLRISSVNIGDLTQPSTSSTVEPVHTQTPCKSFASEGATSSGVKVDDETSRLPLQNQDDAELNSDDDLSEDESRATFVLQSQQVPVASTSTGAGEGSYDTLRCDSCRGAVTGIRQVCVECEYTHCMSCEAHGAHAHHYMLRVPGPRPEGVVRRIVKMIQMELADIISDVQPTVEPSIEPEMIKIEIKTEPEPDPLAEEQLTQSVLEQSMLDIVVKEEFHYDDEVVDPPDESAALQAAPSASSDCTATLPTTYPVPAPGESSSNRRGSSSASQASAAKKTFITVDGGSIGPVTVKTEPLNAEESLQTHQEESGPGETGVTSNKTTRLKRGETGGERKGSAAKKKVKQ